MNKATILFDAITALDDDLIVEAQQPPPSLHRRRWLFAAAACLLLLICVTAFLPQWRPDTPQTSPDTLGNSPSAGGPPYVTIDGTNYIVSSHISSYDDCPEGFIYTGVIEYGEMSGCEYYTNPALPEHIYLLQQTNTDGTIDPVSGAVRQTDWHMAYVRYARPDIRGRRFICYNGQLYLSMWCAWDAIDTEFYDEIDHAYGPRIEADSVEGFSSLGTTAFCGYDTFPTGALSSNEGVIEAFSNPADPRVLLVSDIWYTAPDSNGEVLHRGYEVYVIYEQDTP